ncbi:MAG: FAD-dependent oxidoreductase [Anaerolineae bacterium]|nr:FAD-dependent oxidoreductase [Anaerolineae bacterium]
MSEKQYRALQRRIEAFKQASQTAKDTGLSRREFLGMAGVGVSVWALRRAVPKINPQQAKTIIVVGAGASGIATARELHDAGHTVTILEARDRIGGRVWTDTRMANTPLDLGASWIHGIEDNPVWELTQEYNIPTQPSNYEDSFPYSADGDVVSEDDILLWDGLLEDLLTRADAILEETEADMSLREVVNLALADMDIAEDDRHALEAILMSGIEGEYANSLERLSSYYWDDSDEFDGDDVLFPRGYVEVFQNLADGLDIRLNQAVTEIKYTPEGVTLITATERYFADKVVLTVPLGVLKRGTIAFSPPLPQNKLDAIARLDMGALNKVYLLFSDVFWSEGTQFFTIADDRVSFVNWVNFYPITGKPILMAFYSGREQARLEALSEADIIAEALDVLSAIFEGVHDLFFEGIATRWGQDPFAYGSYSSYAVGSSPDDREALSEPLEGVLYFAGEATRTDHPATVHGAVMSGYDVADAILED